MRLVIDMDDSEIIYKESGELPEPFNAYAFVYRSHDNSHSAMIGFYHPYYDNNKGCVFDWTGVYIGWDRIIAWECLQGMAISIAIQFHKWQKDMNGEPYILHPLRVMMKMETFEEKVVGVLHDILEDTECSIEYINARCELSKDIKDALLAITRMSDEKYYEYVERLNKNSLARKVKIADLVDNLSRTGAPISLRKRYYKALGILCGEDNLPLLKMIEENYYELLNLENM